MREAERQGLFGFHFFIKENDLGTAKRRFNMAERKEMLRRGKRRAGHMGLNLKECSHRAMKEQRALTGAADMGGDPDLARTYCFTLGLSFRIHLFIYVCQLCFKHCWR